MMQGCFKISRLFLDAYSMHEAPRSCIFFALPTFHHEVLALAILQAKGPGLAQSLLGAWLANFVLSVAARLNHFPSRHSYP